MKPSGSLNPHGAPILKTDIVANSITITVNDSLKASSGFLALGTAGALVQGHATSLVTFDGVGLTENGAGGNYTNTYATTSDNQTVAKLSAVVDISKATLYSAELNATIGTNSSDLLGYNMDLTDEDTLDESSATTATAQYHNWGIDEFDSTKAFVNIRESSVFGV